MLWPALVLQALAPLVASQDSPQRMTFRVAVEAVQIDVYVGRRGKAVLGLTRNDFELYDNGVPQSVDLVEVRTVPLSLALVLDVSDSMRGTKLRRLKEASHALVDELEAIDRTSILSFSHVLERRTDLVDDRELLHRAIETVEAQGATVWHDALFAGLKMLENEGQRSLLLLFTDGEDTYSWLREEQLEGLVRESNAVIYAISLPDPVRDSDIKRQWKKARDGKERTKLLRELTESSGGRLIEAEEVEHLRAAFLRVLSEMKTRYLLSYRPESGITEGWHDVKVKLKRGKADIRARRGYFYETP